MKNSLVSFDNTEIAFSGKSDKDISRAYWLFKIISFNWLVQISPPFVNFALRARLPVKGLIRATAFRHFCGGENISDCNKTIEQLGKYHIGTILDYSVEGKEDEKEFDATLSEILATIQRAKGDKNIPFSVFKPTGLARLALLEKVNDEKNLSDEERKEFERVKERVNKICHTAFENDVPVFIDAEQSWIQNTLDGLAEGMMRTYNKSRPIVYNTAQMYRTDRLAYLEKILKDAQEKNYFAGIKIVRGAYMEKERKRAAELGYPSPIQPDKKSCDEEYDASMRFCIDHIDKISLCAGTHNENSSLFLTELMREKNIPVNHPHIWFSQLYGMSDHISYNLSKLGYNVCKYVPYGPVTAVLPYLIRRAQENTSVKGQTGRELSLIMQERKRRKSLKTL